MEKRRLVYTAMIGGHELLQEQPAAPDSACDFVCFTDDATLRSETWDVRVVDPLLPLDPVRSARSLKIVGHPDLDDYDEVLWIDARVVLRGDPSDLLDDWLATGDLAVARHSYRKDVATEFVEVLLAGMDESSRLYEQLNHYTAVAPDRLQEPVPWTGLIARRWTPDVRRFGEEWLRHVLRYSRRDQLSFVEAAALSGAGFRLLDLSTFGSEVHEWMPGEGRSPRPQQLQVSDHLWSPTARLGELQRQLEITTREMSAAVDHRENLVAGLEQQVAELNADRAAEVQRLQGQVATLERSEQLLAEKVERLRRKVRRLRTRKDELESQVDDRRRGPRRRRASGGPADR
ncbi:MULTISPECIES: glycosyltransferase domain-containing protein [unclassified Nocardioides]|uniref:glycosyltransferase domain-containing protein n=1 Tax=unclassified Nocardioides TaxID=2615069 RepID=UPI00361A6352